MATTTKRRRQESNPHLRDTSKVLTRLSFPVFFIEVRASLARSSEGYIVLSLDIYHEFPIVSTNDGVQPLYLGRRPSTSRRLSSDGIGYPNISTDDGRFF